MSSKYQKHKEMIVLCMNILAGEGLMEYTAGHVSVRLENDLLLMPGHIHPLKRTISSLTVDDIVLCDLEGRVVEGELSLPGEKYIHTEIYKARPDVRSIVHSHPPVSTAFSITDQRILPVTHRSVAFAPSVPVFSRTCQINNPELGQELAVVLGEARAVLLRGHGAVVVGKSLKESCVLSCILEKTAEMQLKARTIGRIPEAIPYTITELGEEFIDNPWSYLLEEYLHHRK